MGSPAVTGVVHLGLGAFHRAHQACVFDRLIQQGDKRWGVFGCGYAQPRRLDCFKDTRLAILQCKWLAHMPVIGRRLVPSQDGCVAALERQRVVDKLASADTRWVTLTVTEKGYDAALGQLLLEGFAARFAQLGVSPAARLTVASCDNLSHNGDSLRNLCLNTLMHTNQDSALKNLGDYNPITCVD